MNRTDGIVYQLGKAYYGFVWDVTFDVFPINYDGVLSFSINEEQIEGAALVESNGLQVNHGPFTPVEITLDGAHYTHMKVMFGYIEDLELLSFYPDHGLALGVTSLRIAIADIERDAIEYTGYDAKCVFSTPFSSNAEIAYQARGATVVTPSVPARFISNNTIECLLLRSHQELELLSRSHLMAKSYLRTI